MNLEEFREGLELVRDGELIRHAQRCLCQAFASGSNSTADSDVMLDLIYAECARRGKERLYDKAYEMVCRKPDVCKTLMA